MHVLYVYTYTRALYGCTYIHTYIHIDIYVATYNYVLLFIPQMQNKPINILQHRMVKNVITHYWKSALKYWIGSRIIHFLNTIILTLFILNLPHPKGNICKEILNMYID